MLILAIILFLIVGGFILGYFSKDQDAESFGFGTMITGVVLLVLFSLAAFITTGVQYHNASNVENSQFVVEELERQRDVFAEALQDSLSTEEFAALLEAQNPDDLAFLKHNSEVTTFMLGRADRIVGINVRLYAERNELLKRARSVCNFRANPFVPQFPIVRPDCRLGELEQLFASADLPVETATR